MFSYFHRLITNVVAFHFKLFQVIIKVYDLGKFNEKEFHIVK